MKEQSANLRFLCVLLLSTFVLTAQAQAADVTVDCDKKKTITAALAGLDKHGPNTIHVSGACNESVTIDGFDRLTLTGNAGASITATGAWVIAIIESDQVTVEGLAVTATDASIGLACLDLSVCTFRDLTVEGGGVGIQYARASGLVLRNTVIQHSLGDGLLLADAKVTLSSNNTTFPVIHQNAGNGIRATDGSTLVTVAVTIEGNSGDGINAASNSTVRLSRTIIQSNGGSGINLQSSSVALIANDSTITANGANGVRLGDLSFARFQGSNTITTLGAPKVLCQQQFSATRGVASVTDASLGETNCAEPAP